MVSLNPENSLQQDLDDSGCVGDASMNENGYRGYAQLLDLSDDVLLCILQYCTPRDLKALGHTCPRLGTLICDRTLWTKVDARNSPIGQQRLRWLLTHCLSPATTELKIAGYANKYSRCLGIQDLAWPVQADQEFIRGTCIGAAEGIDVEHFLLRMWYPHLPRFAVSPRWPDKAEADSKNAKAAEASTSKSGESSSSSGQPDVKLSSLGPNTEGVTRRFEDKPCSSGNSGPTLDKSGQSSCNTGPRSRNFGQKTGSSEKTGQNSTGKLDGSDLKKEGRRDEYPILFEDDIWDECKGPQFSLTTRLLKDLRKQCSQLTSLALEYCNLDYKTTNLRHFPLNLKKLSLRGSRCYNLPLNTSYLGKVQERLPKLEYLDVSECDWFEPASLMPLSKLPVLTELYMRDCKRLTECVAYASLATRYGFRKLRVFDGRGSPLADPEVSAFGWLPCLEELYVSPPEEFNVMTEHTHSWSDTKTVFTELDSWEIEEPEYYKIKTPEPDQDEDDKDEELENDRPGDVLINNPWWSHERRIIVIQPNANRQLEERYPLARQAEGIVPENAAILRPLRVGPAGPRRPLNDFVMGPVAPEEYPEDLPADPRLRPMRSIPGSIDPSPHALELAARRRRPLSPRPPGPANPRPVPADPRQECTQKRQGPAETRQSRPGPSQAGPANPQPGPSNPQSGPANPQPGPANPQPGPDNSEESGSSKRRSNVLDAIDLAKRRRLEDNDDEEMDPLPPQINVPLNPQLCPRLRNLGDDEPVMRHPQMHFQRNAHPIMHIDVDIHRQSNVNIGNIDGYNFVTDSALLRFGRAENENVNYVHIGTNGIHHGSESGSRPDRSNLRILSVTGYRTITDRSLEHLATAAPYLLHVDFSETNVTPRGVEMFKAVRPDCEVVYSKYNRNK